MIRNYLKITLRLFWKNKLYTFFNLAGLTTGLVCVLLIFSFINLELSYDQSYSNASFDYRVIFNQKEKSSISTPSWTGKTLTQEFPEVAASTSCQKGSQSFLVNDGSVQIPVIQSDSNFFKVFDLKFIYGDPRNALKNKNAIVITESTSKRFFPDKNPVGRYLTDKSGVNVNTLEITGVIHDIPLNTHIQADGITSSLNADLVLPVNWVENFMRPQYIRLREGANIKMLENKLKTFYKTTNAPADVRFTFQPVKDIHLYSEISDDQFAEGSIKNIYIYSFAALLVLLMGCVNYLNLATASSMQRTKEIGVRKILGGNKKQIRLQFIMESLLLFLSVIPITLILSVIAWPVFMKELGYTADIHYLINGKNILALIGICLFAGTISAAYPAIFLANLNPNAAISDSTRKNSLSAFLKRGLVIFQFTISSFLIVSTLVAYKQLIFLNKFNYGLNQENLLILGIQRFDRAENFLSELKADRRIKDVAVSNFSLGDHFSLTLPQKSLDDSLKVLDFAVIDADISFANTLQLQMKEGRFFSDRFGIDQLDIDSVVSAKGDNLSEADEENIRNSRPLILSDLAVSKLNIKKPIGHVLNLGNDIRGTIVGVIKNIEGISVKRENPLVILRVSNEHAYYGYTYVRFNKGDIRDQINFLQEKWKSYFPGMPFTFTFADDRLKTLYTNETRQANLFAIFSLFSIVIACVGLFSLVTLSLQQRIKEIGIRKVLGASIPGIIRLVLKEFVILVSIAILVAIPLEWLIMNKWLEGFAYRTKISLPVLMAGGLFIIVISFVTVIIEVFKAARVNPVESLRST